MLQTTVVSPHIHVVGVGGTGGYLTDMLVRLFALDFKGTIHLYDGDTVELKNLKRQSFRLDDLDKPKVEAMQTFWTNHLEGCPNIVTHTEYLTDTDTLEAELLLEEGTPILISCVDNVATRKLLQKVFDDYDEPMIFIDSGNNDKGGQVVWTTNRPVELSNPFGDKKDVWLKSFLETYPELMMIEDTNPGMTNSCQDVVDEYPQAMLCNTMNAQIIANIVYNLVKGNPLGYNSYSHTLENMKSKIEMKEGN